MKRENSRKWHGWSRRAWARGMMVGMIALGWTGFAGAQTGAPTRVEASISDVTIIMQKTPEFQASVSDNKKGEKRREWLEVEMKFKTLSDSQTGIIPEVMVQYYLAVDSGTPQVLTGSFVYTNIVDKEDNYAVVYVSPPGLTRLAGAPNKFSVRDVKTWGVEILYQGRVVAESSKAAGRWWTATAAPRTTDLLQPKEKTPFRMLWIDRHVELKE